MIDSREELEKFKRDINLVEYAAYCGYEKVKSKSTTSSTAMISNGHSIMIGTSRNGHGVYYSFSHADGGSIIDFVQNRENINIGFVKKELRSFMGEASTIKVTYSKPAKVKKDLSLVRRAFDEAKAINSHPYLIDIRKISAETLADERFSEMIKIDNKGNSLFPHFNNEGLCGFEIKGKDFTRFSAGGTRGIWRSANIIDSKVIVITESVIDALSYSELKPKGMEVAYISVGGMITSNQLELIKSFSQDKKIIVATDNDVAGNRYYDQIAAIVSHSERDTPPLKDWNDYLKRLRI